MNHLLEVCLVALTNLGYVHYAFCCRAVSGNSP
jgi:hypothetical protein